MERTFLLCLITTLATLKEGAAQRKNVLFLAVDDLRPQLGCYLGQDFPSPVHPTIHTPNIDKLAAKSLLLKRAYVQQAICSPSRVSLLTGRRPDTTHVYDIISYFRTVGGNFTTIPQYFKENGYVSIGMGKIFHPGTASNKTQDAPSWSVPYYHTEYKRYWTEKQYQPSHKALPKSAYVDKPLPDIEVTDHAKEVLRNISEEAMNNKQPFFLAVGMLKPHLPFIFPEEFLDLYPLEDIKLPDNDYAPVNMPDVAWSDYGELRKYKDIKVYNFSGDINSTLPDDLTKELRRYYYAATSHIDSLIGEILTELEDLGLANNTIISFWGDHGWQLGEHGEWTKHTNFELATHAPMMVHIPGLTDSGVITEKLTEFVDLFPTLVDAAGLPPIPLCPRNSTLVKVCTEGTSLMPLIRNPATTRWKTRVFSQYPRHHQVMGYSMKTDKYRYTEWVHFSGEPLYKPDWNINYGTELYDHTTDPEENYNRADDPDAKDIIKTLSQELHAGWRAALPSR